MLRYLWTFGLAGAVSAGLMTLPAGCSERNSETKIEREVESSGGSVERKVEVEHDSDSGDGRIERKVEVKRDVDHDDGKVKVEKKSEVKHDHD